VAALYKANAVSGFVLVVLLSAGDTEHDITNIFSAQDVRLTYLLYRGSFGCNDVFFSHGHFIVATPKYRTSTVSNVCGPVNEQQAIRMDE